MQILLVVVVNVLVGLTHEGLPGLEGSQAIFKGLVLAKMSVEVRIVVSQILVLEVAVRDLIEIIILLVAGALLVVTALRGCVILPEIGLFGQLLLQLRPLFVQLSGQTIPVLEQRHLRFHILPGSRT